MEKKDLPQRKSIRWKEFNYSSQGAYFLTICTFLRRKILAQVCGKEIKETKEGLIVLREWSRLPDRFPHVVLDRFVILPDHIHGILFLQKEEGVSILQIIRTFKGISSAAINRLHRKRRQRVWQRSFFDRFLRDEGELDQAREYIKGNPIRWIEKHGPFHFQ